MPAAPKPNNEKLRLEALQSYSILDTLPEKEYDQITKLAATICGTPISLVSLVDADRQWFKSRTGLDATATSRDLAFCAHAILDPKDPLIVENALEDERFLDNNLVTGPPDIRFYAGITLTTPDGYSIGTLCVIDQIPRKLSPQQIEALVILANNVVSLLELRKSKLEQNKLIEQLRISNKNLNQFALIASHDLQEPIRMINSYVTLLSKKYSGNLDEKADRFINYAVDGCKQMEKLIDGLLAFSRVESNDDKAEKISCHDVLEQVVIDFELKIKETNASIKWKEMPTVIAVPSQLKIVFRNLLGNAMKYCVDRAPEIHISAEKIDGFYKFSVKDNGIGIKSEYQSKIFEMFKRLHSRKEFKGTGIGLTITKQIIERHGGTISLDSIPDEGTTFYFTIPVNSRTQYLEELKIANY